MQTVGWLGGCVLAGALALASTPVRADPPPVVVMGDVGGGACCVLIGPRDVLPPMHLTSTVFIGGLVQPRTTTMWRLAVGYAVQVAPILTSDGRLVELRNRHLIALVGLAGPRGRLFWQVGGGPSIDLLSHGGLAPAGSIIARFGIATRSGADRTHRLIGGIGVAGDMLIEGDSSVPQSSFGVFLGYGLL